MKPDDEMAARVRSLNAERARHVRDKPPTRERAIPELLGELIGALHDLYRTPPDKDRR